QYFFQPAKIRELLFGREFSDQRECRAPQPGLPPRKITGCLRREPIPIRGSKHHVDTSKISSSSTGVPSGRLATPNTIRQGFLSFPKTSCSNSEAPSAIFG